MTRLHERLRSVGKANEALTRIGMGLAANPSVTESEMLLYVHATVAPFLLPQVLFPLSVFPLNTWKRSLMRHFETPLKFGPA